MLELEVSVVEQMCRGSVCGRVCREECCSNAELYLNPNIS